MKGEPISLGMIAGSRLIERQDRRLQGRQGHGLLGEDKDLFTPLHVAAAVGNLSAVSALMECGASLTEINLAGNTPVHTATLNGNVEFNLALRGGARTRKPRKEKDNADSFAARR